MAPAFNEMKLKTERLELIPATLVLLNAELQGRETFQKELGTDVPENWPPDLYDRPALEFFISYLKGNPDAVGWAPWYLVLRGSERIRPSVIGTMGFKGKPSVEGTTEIGYSILKEHQRQGYATEAAGGLIRWAFSRPEVNRVIAETHPELIPSIRVLEKNGFCPIDGGSEPGVILYELSRVGYVKRIQQMQKERK